MSRRPMAANAATVDRAFHVATKARCLISSAFWGLLELSMYEHPARRDDGRRDAKAPTSSQIDQRSQIPEKKPPAGCHSLRA
jgi:hypothetical protein